MSTPPRLLVFFTAAVLVVVLVIAALTTEQWWLLPVAFVVLLAAAALTLMPVMKALDQGEKPDPVTDARLEDEGSESALGLQTEEAGRERGGDEAA